MSETSALRPDRLVVVALVVAVGALAVAIWALLSTPSAGEATSAGDEASSGGEDSSEEAGARVCGAFDTVRNAVSLQTNADLGADPVAVQAVAANARLATLGGGQYLLTQLSDATPSDLAESVRSFATTLQDIGIGQLAGSPANDPAQVQRLYAAQDDAARISELCQQ
ncbi:hypothetical protein ACEWX3_03660 [Mycobacterium sp. G7A2]|uniref:hypothetical protein n=1 Tax=Mycobacterium sp. G7A2 TaxID=3317307 RepID=UPI0035A8FB74